MIKGTFCLFLSFCIFLMGCTTVGTVTLNTDDYDCSKSVPKIKKGKAYDIYYKEKYCTSLTPDQWDALVKAAGKQAELTKAEEAKVKRVYAELKDNPWILPLKGKTKTTITVIWKDEQGRVLKQVPINLLLERENKDDPCIKIKIYAYVVTGVVITVILIIVLLILRIVDADKNPPMELCYAFDGNSIKNY